jgi:hypothetical protein
MIKTPMTKTPMMKTPIQGVFCAAGFFGILAD